MSEFFEIDKTVYVPIDEYEDLLNYVSEKFGTPLSVNAIREGAIFEYLAGFYKSAIETLTKRISHNSFESSPNARKNTLSEFQKRFLDVPEELCLNPYGKSYSYAQDVRSKIDINSPNFINSLGIYWSNLDSNRRIATYLPHLKYVENEVDAQGNPLYVLRPEYSRKEGATHRINTTEPNIQALNKGHRRNFLLPRQGFLFVQADISGQDPSVFFNGLCRDEDIIRGFYEVGEYYIPVVSKITNTPYDQVDTELRDSYKVGILSIMNGKTEKNLAIDMGSEIHARNLVNFIESNENYKRFLQSIQREIKLPRPMSRSLVGDLSREITLAGWKGLNQLRNSPIQMTGIALFSISIFEYFRQITNMYEPFQTMSFEEILEYTRPVLHLHDEVILETRDIDNLPELSARALEFALQVKYEDWAPMKAKPVIGNKYML